jgi:hypothetical protein
MATEFGVPFIGKLPIDPALLLACEEVGGYFAAHSCVNLLRCAVSCVLCRMLQGRSYLPRRDSTMDTDDEVLPDTPGQAAFRKLLAGMLVHHCASSLFHRSSGPVDSGPIIHALTMHSDTLQHPRHPRAPTHAHLGQHVQGCVRAPQSGSTCMLSTSAAARCLSLSRTSDLAHCRGRHANLAIAIRCTTGSVCRSSLENLRLSKGVLNLKPSSRRERDSSSDDLSGEDSLNSSCWMSDVSRGHRP